MMEKYGTDLDTLPATPEQMDQIKKICFKTGADFELPGTRKEAEQIIEKLSKDGAIE